MSKSLRSRGHRALVSIVVEARKEAGLTQRELATRMKVTQSVVATIESGQRRMDVVEFMEWAKAVGADPVDLFTRLARR